MAILGNGGATVGAVEVERLAGELRAMLSDEECCRLGALLMAGNENR